MATWTYPADKRPEITLLDCSSKVTITTWDEPAIEIVSPAEEHRLRESTEQVGARLSITALAEEVRIRLPRTARVEIERQAGDVNIEGVTSVRLVDIRGDAVLHAISSDVELERLSGNLQLQGAGTVVARKRIGGDAHLSDAVALELDEIGGDVSIADVPSVQIGSVGGDAAIRSAGERCTIGQVGGDIRMREVGPTQIGQVGGDIRMQEVGPTQIGQLGGNIVVDGVRGLELGEIGGDMKLTSEAGAVSIGTLRGDLKANLRQGPLKLGQARGDAVIEGVPAGLEIGQLHGDLNLHLKVQHGVTYQANVRGDAVINLEEGANLGIQAVVKGDIVGVSARGGARIRTGVVNMTFGTGGARLVLAIGGDLVVRGAGAVTEEWSQDWGAFGEAMAQLGQDLAGIGREFGSSLGAGFGSWAGSHHARRPRGSRARRPVPPVPPIPPVFGFHIDKDRIERIKQEAHEAARSGIAQAYEAVERALRQAGIPSGPATGATVDLRSEQRGEPPTDEERLAILRMVEQGRITPEEAEMLLSALES